MFKVFDQRCFPGSTPLHVALVTGRSMQVVKLLIAASDLSKLSRDLMGHTALSYARNSSLQVQEYLTTVVAQRNQLSVEQIVRVEDVSDHALLLTASHDGMVDDDSLVADSVVSGCLLYTSPRPRDRG